MTADAFAAVMAGIFVVYGTWRAADPNASYDLRAGVHNGGLNYWRGSSGRSSSA